jgi:heme A synthase
VHGRRQELLRPAWVLVALVGIQITLGGLVIWTGKDFTINTLHVATGAAVLGTSLVITLRTFRVRVADRMVTA